MTDFNLIDKPWIQVMDHEGKEHLIGIKEVFQRAHEFSRLSSDLETMNFAILRVLLAILYRAWDDKRWKKDREAAKHWFSKWKLLNDEESPTTLYDVQLEKYLNKWYQKFDICHPTTPFYQVSTLHTSKNEFGDIRSLLLDNYKPDQLFLTRSEMNALSPAEAARCLIHSMAYDPSGIKSGAIGDSRVKDGKGYPIGVGWSGWLGGTILEKDTLAETLLLNYCPKHNTTGSITDKPLDRKSVV